MARSIATIQAALIADVIANFTALANDPNTSVEEKQELLKFVANTSKRAIWRQWTFNTAVAIALSEQQIDVLQAQIEGVIAKAPSATPNFIQDKVLNYFQYDPNVPQVVQIVNLIPFYPIEDPSLRIITRCSVVTLTSYIVEVKVAKQNPPVQLLTAEEDALKTFLKTIGIAGVKYEIVNLPSDKIYIEGEIKAFGSYSAVMETNVIAAINNYLASIPFNGVVKVIDIEKTIRNVEGVDDVILKNVRARNHSEVFPIGTSLINNFTLVKSFYETLSGYIVEETTALQDFSKKLTFSYI